MINVGDYVGNHKIVKIVQQCERFYNGWDMDTKWYVAQLSNKKIKIVSTYFGEPYVVKKKELKKYLKQIKQNFKNVLKLRKKHE